jgi:hypothetical protein
MEEFELTELQYVETGSGPWRLYIYSSDGLHSGGKWFRAGKPKYPDEEIAFQSAFTSTAMAMLKGLEVRITDGGDMLVFHAQGDKILYGNKFWEEAKPNTTGEES